VNYLSDAGGCTLLASVDDVDAHVDECARGVLGSKQKDNIQRAQPHITGNQAERKTPADQIHR
jgi:hypothetical protein